MIHFLDVDKQTIRLAPMKRLWPKMRSSVAPNESRMLCIPGGGMQFLTGASDYARSSSSTNNMASPLNVNEEYKKVIRTKSYAEIWNKVHHINDNHQHHLVRSHSSPITPTRGHGREINSNNTSNFTSPSPPLSFSPSSSVCSYSHLSEYLDVTEAESFLRSTIHDPNLLSLLLDYFHTSLEAGRVCATLLSSIDRIRRDHHIVHRLLKVTATATTAQCMSTLLPGLTSFVELENPLSHLKRFQFRRVHDLHASLIKRLALSHRKITRRIKLLRLLKHVSGVLLVVAFGGFSVAVLVAAAHGQVGALAAAVPVAMCVRRWVSRAGPFRPRQVARLGEQVDAAAKGTYIMSRDMDTMSRMVTRLHDEIEHGKDVVRLFLRSEGERYVLREVTREMEGNEVGFLEQLDEIEEHVHWCLKTIKRTRRLVVHELGGGGSSSGDTTSPTTTATTRTTDPVATV